MIPLILAQLAARWGQAVTLLALSMLATVAVAGAPVYLAAVERAVIADEASAADPLELTMVFPTIQRDAAQSPREVAAETASEELTDFVPVTTVEVLVHGLVEADEGTNQRLVSRDGFCHHVTFDAGRCPVTNREVALPAGLAVATGRTVGDDVQLTVAGTDPPEVTLTVMIVGVFTPVDAGHPYWGVTDLVGGAGTGAIFTTRNTLLRADHPSEYVHHHAFLPVDRLTPERIPEIRAEVAQAQAGLASLESAGLVTAGTGVPQLLDRISRSVEQSRTLLPVATVPLVALCWFVLYFAVRQGVSARRPEIGAVVLRGASPRVRAVVVAAEPLVPVLVAAPVGLLAAHALIVLVGPSGVEVPVTADQWLAVGMAGLGSAIAVLLAIRRELAAPVAELLRRTFPRGRLAVAAVEVVVVALAAVVVVQLRGFDGTTTGVLAAAPALVMLAAVLLCTRLLRPLTDRLGRIALRRGRLAGALAALHLARRPGAAQLVVVVGLALGMLGFAVIGVDVAAQGRTALAEQRLGAPRVLTVEPTDRAHLLQAVRAADPTGEHAMAVLAFPGEPELPVLAVDTTRLASVAVWSDTFDAPEPDRLADLLRPPAEEPAWIDDGELVADLTLGGDAGDGTVTASVVLATANQSGVEVISLGPLRGGRAEYRATVTDCPDGCRIAAVSLRSSDRRASGIQVTWHALRRAGTDLVPAGWFTHRAGWRTTDTPRTTGSIAVSTTTDGLRTSLRDARIGVEYEALPVTAPYPLPLVTTTRLAAGEWLDNVDGRRLRVVEAAQPAGLPGIGDAGAMVDLEYADRSTSYPGVARSAMVWLAADAPAEMVDRLASEGLVVSGDRSIDELRDRLDASGAATGIRYHLLAAGLAVLVAVGAVALVAAVDRRTWGEPMQRLRVQGVAERTTTVGALWSYGGLVVAGAVAGAFGAAAAWWAAGDRLPLELAGAVVPAWPRWSVALLPWSVAVAGFVLMALAAAGWQRRVTRRTREERG